MSRRPIAVSRASRDALAILGGQIKTARLRRRWTQADLAGRIGVDFRTLAAVEKGAPHVAVGTVFNAAFTVGVNLFGLDGDELTLARRRGEETLALLPRTARPRHAEAGDDDNF